MPEDPKYRLGDNDIIDSSLWTGGNLKTVIDALNSSLVPSSIIKQERLNVADIPIPLVDGGNLDV